MDNKDEGMQYIRCPRCELNFIHKKDKLCSVCKREVEAAYKNEGEDGDIDLGVDFEICPICKTNYIREDEDMCASCARERDVDRNLHGTSIVEEEENIDDYENDNLKEDDEFGDMIGIADEDEMGGDLDDLDLDINVDDDDIDFEDLDEVFDDMDDDEDEDEDTDDEEEDEEDEEEENKENK